MEDPNVQPAGEATAEAPASSVVPEGAAPSVVEGATSEPTPEPEPVDVAPVEPVPVVVPEPAVPEAPAVPDDAPRVTEPEAEDEGDEQPPEPTPGDVSTTPAPAPEPVPADETEDEAEADIKDYAALSDVLETMAHELADQMVEVGLDDFRKQYEAALKQWQDVAQRVHTRRYGNPLREAPQPDFKILSPADAATLAWVVSFFGRHVSPGV